jgi:hypothetical protein
VECHFGIRIARGDGKQVSFENSTNGALKQAPWFSPPKLLWLS